LPGAKSLQSGRSSDAFRRHNAATGEMGEPSFSDLKHRYLDAVCFALGLVEADRRIAGNWGIVRARGKLASVYFEHDRGLCHFSVGPASADKQTCSVDEIAHRFPRIRALPFGDQRLSLEEQCDFIQSHWTDLQRDVRSGWSGRDSPVVGR